MDDPFLILDELRTIHRRLRHYVRFPLFYERETMAALDELQALAPRLDAIITAVGTDTATAVANATAALQQQLADATATATKTESDTQAAADVLTAKVSTLETNLGIAPPAQPEPTA